MKTGSIEEGNDIEGGIDKQIAESNAIARKNLVEQLEEVLQESSIVVVKSPGDGSISLKTDGGATIMFTSVGKDARLEVTVAYNRRSTI